MAELTSEGAVRARCPDCSAVALFGWLGSPGHPFGAATKGIARRGPDRREIEYRLFRCSGCGTGGLGVVVRKTGHAYPGGDTVLEKFTPDVTERVRLPGAVPDGIRREFREAEACMDAGCLRAAAGMFRSVLDKTMRASGYKDAAHTLAAQIDLAAGDGVITQARKLRAHEDIRVLGNDVLHDEWVEIKADAVEAAHHYSQRILEDLYDDRPSVLKQLLNKGRKPTDHPTVAPPGGQP